jgi:hypothetical protein
MTNVVVRDRPMTLDELNHEFDSDKENCNRFNKSITKAVLEESFEKHVELSMIKKTDLHGSPFMNTSPSNRQLMF